MEIIKKNFYLENKRWIIGSVIFAILLLLPIFTLFYKLIYIEGNSFNYLWENILFEYTFNTFYLIIITSFFSLLFGVIPAWFISNYRFKGRNFLDNGALVSRIYGICEVTSREYPVLLKS